MKSMPLPSISRLALAVGVALAPLAAQNVGLTLVNNNTNDYLDAPYSPTVVPRTGITVEAWVIYDDTTLPAGFRWPTIVRQNATPGQESYFLRVQAGNTNARVLSFAVRTPGGNRSANWTFAPGQLNVWTHVAATYDGANVALFINGVQVATAVGTGAIVDTGGVFRIGCGDLTGSIENWNGQLDEVRLWPFARTAGEITATMNMELVSVPGEVSSWNLNNSGIDTSGTNTAIAVNSPVFANNTLNLQTVSFPAINYGNATAGCQGLPRIAATTAPRVGGADFALASLRCTTTGAGVFWLGTAALNPPINVLGVDLLINPASPNVQLSIPGGTLNFTRVPLPIPAVNALRNIQLVSQMIWAEPGCATPLFATDGIQFGILP
jgi:hypothetical protein